jgi:hypothetical protein
MHHMNMSVSEIYRTTKHVYSALQIDGKVRVETVQVGMLIAIYEVSHGLQTQANFTVSSCATMLQILDLDTSPIRVNQQSRMLERLKSSLLRLDR